MGEFINEYLAKPIHAISSYRRLIPRGRYAERLHV